MAITEASSGDIVSFKPSMSTNSQMLVVVTVIFTTYVNGNCINFFHVGFVLYVKYEFKKNEPTILSKKAQICAAKYGKLNMCKNNK